MEDNIFKEAIVIGNGPSAISLSYMLAGNWPYYNGLSHSNEYLHYRLEEGKHKSLFEQDLSSLSSGLEGRSLNPMSVLFDALVHPDADLGIENPSVISWHNYPSEAINHVVIGKGIPGGSWQKMDNSSLTISLGSWMELPNFSIKTWNASKNRCFSSQSRLRQKRATIGSIAEYYRAYVDSQNLSPYFINNATVTTVSLLEASYHETLQCLWKVEGHVENSEDNFSSQQTKFTFISPNVVLATGNSDQPNRLNVKGESLPFVLYSLSDLENVIKREINNPNVGNILIIGAGLSAADAIIAARFYGIPILHVFRRSACDPDLIFNKLPPDIYPEYHKVHQMMQNSSQGHYEGYKAFPCSNIHSIQPDGTVILTSIGSKEITSRIKASYVLVLIGQHPNLSFLPDRGFKIGVKPEKLIDCKNNPIDINLDNHESVTYPGIFAVGPIVGDNFVRFVQGGCFAVANQIINTSKHKNM